MITIIFIILAGIFSAIMDLLRVESKYNQSVFSLIKNKKLKQWIDPNYSWKNKYKKSPFGEIILESRFIGSTTIFVFVTDLWHFSKFGMLMCLMIAIVNFKLLINPIIDIFMLYTIFCCTFELFYSIVLVKKTYNKLSLFVLYIINVIYEKL